jgi:O-acetyl-ADP-ribose deacetylase (regulator of RNase III)
MITYKKGNIFDSKCDILINPINKVGVMGAGLAKQFKQRYPEMFDEYVEWCNGKRSYKFTDLQVEDCLFLYENGYEEQGVIGFPTKNHWGNKSDIKLIEEGLAAIVELTKTQSDKNSFAFPKLGCGLGGLDWNKEVKPLMEYYLGGLDCEIEIYE